MSAGADSPKPDRLNSFSDGVFAVIITILVLELRSPNAADASAIFELWPIAISYVASYFLIAIVWVNHHHLLHHADFTTSRLIWFNFAHLFSVSLVPFSTAWIAETKLASAPVSFYALVFVLVNVTYLMLCREVIDLPETTRVAPRARRLMRVRSWTTLAVFAGAALAATKFPTTAMVMICLSVLVYFSPDASGSQTAKPGEWDHQDQEAT